MASFLSAVSLLLLVLATGCFTLPVIEKFSTSTDVPQSKLEVTTGSVIIDNADKTNMQLLSDEDSTNIPNIQKPRSLPNEDLDVESSTSYLDHTDKSEEQKDVTESPLWSENYSSASMSPRELNEDTLESINEQEERDVRHLTADQLQDAEGQLSSLSREERDEDPSINTDKQDTDSDKDEEKEQEAPEKSDSDVDESKPKYPTHLERELKKQEETELTMTTDWGTFAETSSTIVPQLYNAKPSDSSSETFGKLTGLLTDADKNDIKEHQPRRSEPIKSNKDESSEDVKPAIALLDQNPPERMPNIKDYTMQLEDNNGELNSPLGTILSSDKQNVLKQNVPLTQGEQPVPPKTT